MRLPDLTIMDLKKYKYPNLMAEVKETTYSICTIAEHMGLQPLRKENDEETWSKLMGITDMVASEEFGLANLFGVSMEYLFSHELKVFNGETAAHWRWLERNESVRRELEHLKCLREVEGELRKRPYFLELVRKLITFSDEEIDRFIELLGQKKTV